MQKRFNIITVLLTLCILIGACGKTENKPVETENNVKDASESTASEELESQEESSSAGNWIIRETGSALFLDEDGTGYIYDKLFLNVVWRG